MEPYIAPHWVGDYLDGFYLKIGKGLFIVYTNTQDLRDLASSLRDRGRADLADVTDAIADVLDNMATKQAADTTSSNTTADSTKGDASA